MSMTTEQKSLRDVTQVALKSGANLSIAAAALAILGLIMPFIGMKTNLGMGLDRAGSINAFAAAGIVAWLTSALFILAATARRAPTLAAYINIIDFATFGGAAITLAWAWFFNPIKAELGQVQGLFGSGSKAPSEGFFVKPR